MWTRNPCRPVWLRRVRLWLGWPRRSRRVSARRRAPVHAARPSAGRQSRTPRAGAHLRLLWLIFHLLRLRVSRANEYEADATAIKSYGAQSFINGLTAIQSAAATLRGAGLGIRKEMVKRNNPNFFSELRRHYAELPAEYLGPMRLKSLRGYRTLEHSHPITPDRIRAALALARRAGAILCAARAARLRHHHVSRRARRQRSRAPTHRHTVR